MTVSKIEKHAPKINLSPIFTITSFNVRKDGDIDLRARCVGYYHEFETAEKVVLVNAMNINEDGHYSHVVIEKVEPGLYPVMPIDNRWFYEWKKNKYIKCKKFKDPQPNIISYGPIG